MYKTRYQGSTTAKTRKSSSSFLIMHNFGMAKDRRPLTHDDYTVGWICALPKSELVVAGAMLDEEHPVLPAADPGDTNVYLLGRMGSHNMVIACLPAEKTGTVSAAIVAQEMLRSFRRLRFGLMVGVGGGVPDLNLNNETDDDDEDDKGDESLGDGKDTRLGDVAVSLHSKDSDAVVQYDFGKSLHGGYFFRTGSLNKPPNLLLQAVSMLQGQHKRKGNNLSYHLSEMLKNNPKLKTMTYTHQGFNNDRLFKVDVLHVEGQKSCDACCGNSDASLVIHYGTIGSADQVMKDPALRDAWAKREKIICFEMETAGSFIVSYCNWSLLTFCVRFDGLVPLSSYKRNMWLCGFTQEQNQTSTLNTLKNPKQSHHCSPPRLL
jgi:nucleoside phosphorylase